MQSGERLPDLAQIAHSPTILMLAGLLTKTNGITASMAWRLVDLGDRWRAALAGPPQTIFRDSWILRP
jgi:hypothetical protein